MAEIGLNRRQLGSMEATNLTARDAKWRPLAGGRSLLVFVRAATVVVSASILAACASEPRTIELGSLSDLVLPAENAPTGTELYGAPSGSLQVDTLTLNVPAANAEVGALEFIGGYGRFFVTPGFDPFGSGGAPPPMLIGSVALAFADADDASQALNIHRERVLPVRTSGAVQVDIEDLGEEAHAFTFERAVTAAPGATYAFRVANVVFIVSGSGESLDPNLVHDIARSVADRTRGP